jgi:hypothetical protein
MYDIPGLREKCEELLIDDLSTSNVTEYYQWAFLHDASELKSAAIRLMANKIKESPESNQTLEDILENLMSSNIPK